MKKMMRIFLLTVLSMLCLSVFANAEMRTGKCGDDLTYTLNTETGELVISGTGDMWDWEWDVPPWNNEVDIIKTLTVKDGVTTISRAAFRSSSSLATIALGNSIETIGFGAFENCDALAAITIPDSVTLIEMYAFVDCNALTIVELGKGVEVIDAYAFTSCDALTEVHFAGSETEWNAIAIGEGNEALQQADIFFAPEESAPTVSGNISAVVEGATVEIGGVKADVNADGSFSLPAGEETFDVVIRIPGALTYTVKDVTAANGDIVLPPITPVKGDTNNDGMINIVDMSLFRANFGKTGESITNPHTDTNGDKMVNIIDMSVFRTNFGKTAAKDCTVIYQA